MNAFTHELRQLLVASKTIPTPIVMLSRIKLQDKYKLDDLHRKMSQDEAGERLNDLRAAVIQVRKEIRREGIEQS